jgi:Protein of unknown function (DUF3108)
MRWLAAVILLVLPGIAGAGAGAGAEPGVIDLSYDGYAAGFRMLTLQSELWITPMDYRIVVAGRTAGIVGVAYHAHWQSTAKGTWTDGAVNALRFDSVGVFGGQPRHVAIAFHQGDAELGALQPPDDGEHTPVPPALRHRVIDGLSVTAMVIHQVAKLGRCQGQVRSYDGRTVEALMLRTVGNEVLPASGRSSWHGHTLRCQIDARTLGGFYHDEQSDPLKTHSETLWLGNVLAGVPALPVRMTASSYNLGHIVFYLTGAKRRDAVP